MGLEKHSPFRTVPVLPTDGGAAVRDGGAAVREVQRLDVPTDARCLERAPARGRGGIRLIAVRCARTGDPRCTIPPAALGVT
eukprot:gene22799-27426_t